MTAIEILDRFKKLGVSVQLDGATVRVAPRSLVPDDLMVEAKAHKQELIHELTLTYGDGELPPLDRPPATQRELRRLMDYTVDEENFAKWLAWAMTYTDPSEDPPQSP